MARTQNYKKPPRLLTDAGLSMFVNTVMLRELPLPIIDIEIEKLLWHFDMPVWEKDGTDDWNLRPWEVIRKEDGTMGHQKRILEADISHPIVVTVYNNKYAILDGVHRLAKIYMNGGKIIKAKVIPSEYLGRREFQT
ncbi:MAG TPA: hypothetical protein DEA87_01200 [Candidatus Veblenbacteria bacterium]|uniref:ParB/Sulfiredoxin domain-containing protein n=3 Tax=Candidatus Vebleniibacteriota TaxID=1817921 RepID=A0A1G2Q444_9BACT|nr:MAG: hypothetical protein A2388_00595 [Candidatus Veblenbacteria bacterium RIFOXYB1_FULL_43_13]OHA55327.1 MAG: hypothetical protein A2226_01860 [Candidatus Veblenbacteria bacterium RIFOXYA2_FULL_43_9]OHA57462.1 MAG: hypothetical protein A2441_02790 [Candidatus Veblenbacteria bacterium RIFOXYC2_FULL_42_11]HBT92081.1 hypothetical protein [Candidatus Veblenbacteria bacterium]